MYEKQSRILLFPIYVLPLLNFDIFEDENAWSDFAPIKF